MVRINDRWKHLLSFENRISLDHQFVLVQKIFQGISQVVFPKWQGIELFKGVMLSVGQQSKNQFLGMRGGRVSSFLARTSILAMR